MSSPSNHPFSPPHLKAMPGGVAAIRAELPLAPTGKRAATRHRLMDACSAIVIREGFEAVSMTAVAHEAGITRQTVYRYFPNAREMVRATLLRDGRELLERQLLVFTEDGDPRDLLVEAVLAALRMIDENALLRAAWDSRGYPQAMLRATFDPAFVARAAHGLRPIAGKLGWNDRETLEVYEIIARTVMSFLTIPPPEEQTESELREVLHRRLLPALLGG